MHAERLLPTEIAPDGYQALRAVEIYLAKCGLPTGRDVSRIVMDDFAYTLLWRTREPFLLAYFSGWWGQDLDRNKLIRDRHIAGLVGGCSAFAPEHLPATINYPEIGFCCSRIEPRSSNEH